jgi:hypothetical protein
MKISKKSLNWLELMILTSGREVPFARLVCFPACRQIVEQNPERSNRRVLLERWPGKKQKIRRMKWKSIIRHLKYELVSFKRRKFSIESKIFLSKKSWSFLVHNLTRNPATICQMPATRQSGDMVRQHHIPKKMAPVKKKRKNHYNFLSSIFNDKIIITSNIHEICVVCYISYKYFRSVFFSSADLDINQIWKDLDSQITTINSIF